MHSCTQCMRCGLLLQMLHVAWSVCLSVCWSHGYTVQKQLNRLWCQLGFDSCGHKIPCIRWGQDPPLERAILGVDQPTEKQWKSCCVYDAKGIIQLSITAWQCDWRCPPWKAATPCNVAFGQNSLTTWYDYYCDYH